MIWDICQLQPVFLAGAHSWLNIGQGLYPNVDSAYLPSSLLCSLLVLSLSTEHQLCTHISSISFSVSIQNRPEGVQEIFPWALSTWDQKEHTHTAPSFPFLHILLGTILGPVPLMMISLSMPWGLASQWRLRNASWFELGETSEINRTASMDDLTAG